MRNYDYSSLPRVNDLALSCSADIRSKPEDFQVEEQLPLNLMMKVVMFGY